MQQLEVVGVVSKPKVNAYFIVLENDDRIRVDKVEYQKMKRKLSGKSKHFIDYEQKK